MKLPHHLLRTYRKYKEEERGLLLWIESVTSENDQRPPLEKKKLKGRARTLARRAADAPKLSEDEEADTDEALLEEEPTISILEIIPLVAKIAQNPSIPTIPRRIAGRLTTIIDLRKACVNWFKGNTSQHDTETREKNKRHAFPLTVLKTAMSMLRAKFPVQRATQAKDTREPEVPSSIPEGTTEVSEQEQDDVNLEEFPPLSSELQTAKDNLSPNLPPKYKMSKEEIMQDEFNMAMFCLLRDIQEIEDFMILELVRYSLDQSNADVLPLLSNVAIDLVAKMDASLDEVFDREKLEPGFLRTAVNMGIMNSFARIRMKAILALQLESVPGLHHFRKYQCRKDFDPSSTYFGASVWQQALLEEGYINNMLLLQLSVLGTHRNVLCTDHTLEHIRQFFRQQLSPDPVHTIPAGIVFAFRMAFLATLILNDQPRLPFERLSHTASKLADLAVCRDDFWNSPRYQSARIKTLWNVVKPDTASWRAQHSFFVPSVRMATSWLAKHQLTCAWNDCALRMYYSVSSIQAMEICNIVKLLAHLWNLLREEGHLNFAWPDVEYLLAVLGDEFMFRSSRPMIARSGASSLRSRMVYGLGHKESIVPKPCRKVDSDDKWTFTFGAQYTNSSSPMYALVNTRNEGLSGSSDRIVDLELIATTTVIPKIVGQVPQTVWFNQEAQIENRNKLWVFRDKRPDLQAIELLAVTKNGLLQELRIMDFDYLGFDRAIHELSDIIGDVFDVLQDLPARGGNLATPMEKLTFFVRGIAGESTTSPLLPMLATIFRHWLQDNGHVGVKGLRITGQRPINPKSLLSSLKPDVLQGVKAIVKRRGLREDVFCKDQIDISSINVTSKIEDTIRTVWANSEAKRKKTTKK